MRRPVRSSMNQSDPQLSHAINLFLHKDRTSFFDDDTIASGNIAPYEPQPPLVAPPSFNWDLQYTSAPLVPAFQYISDKLHQRGLSVALIISDQEPHVIPVWPLSRKSQIILVQIVRRAVKKFAVQSTWLTSIACASTKQLPAIFETHHPNSYIVRRSIVQQELVFNGDGLNLLTIDHIYTFKQLLCTLSKRDWIPQVRDVCLSSCVHLLRHINDIYTDPRISSGYLARVYEDIPYHKHFFKEVSAAYDINYCTANIKDVTALEPDITVLSAMDMDYDYESDDDIEIKLDPLNDPYPETLCELGTDHEIKPPPVAELPDSSPHEQTSDIISPMNSFEHPKTLLPEEVFDIISPLTVKHASLPSHSSPPLLVGAPRVATRP